MFSGAFICPWIERAISHNQEQASGLQSSAVTQSFPPPLLSTWPSHLNLLRHTSQLTLLMSANSVTLLFVIFCCHLFISIRRKHCYWKVSSLLSSAFVIFQVSQPYSRTSLSNVLTRRILVLLPFPLADHSFPSLWNVLCAFCSLFLMSLRPPPSLST